MRVRVLPGAQQNMINKKSSTLLIVGLLTIPLLTLAQSGTPIVPCGNGYPGDSGFRACTISDFFTLISNVFSFIVWNVSTPLAGLIVVLGGILIMISGGPGSSGPGGIPTPNLYNKGKSMVWWAIIAWLLVWGSYLIIKFVLVTIGFIGT